MKFKHAVALVVVGAGTAVSLGGGLAAQGAASPDQMVASLKTNLQESQKRLRQYEWIETTAISLKGEEKSRKQQQVYYAADGTLTKVPVGGAPPPQAKGGGGGGRGGGRLKEKVVENKKDEMQEYMARAAKLIQQYVPPNPAQIQKAKDGGHMVVRPPDQGRVRVEFQEFVQPGDLLAIDVDAAASRLSAVSVKTYLDKPDEAVTLDVRYATLPDGTSYVAQTTLEATAKNIKVVVQNSGHKAK